MTKNLRKRWQLSDWQQTTRVAARPIPPPLGRIPATTVNDNAKYKVRVSPFMQIGAMGADQVTTHPMTACNVNFNNQLWHARTPSTTGSIIWLNVSFLTGNLATLKGAQYQMTVVGTIPEN